MDEAEFREELCNILKDNLHGYDVETGKSILYKVIVDSNCEYDPEDPNNPKRGQYAFQTDILISKSKLPLVVIEIKFGGFSTHDIITYSSKAAKHKDVYPHLRYGFIIGGKTVIERKFFVHNTSIDFAIALKSVRDNIDHLVEIIKEQIDSSELLLAVLNDRLVSKYVTKMEIE